MELDRIPLWRGDHVEVRQLVEDFARYVYLLRLQNVAVLAGAIRDGLALLTWERDTFAYADDFDQAARRYRGLRVGRNVPISDTEPKGLLVKPEVASRQIESEKAGPVTSEGEDGTMGHGGGATISDSSEPGAGAGPGRAKNDGGGRQRGSVDAGTVVARQPRPKRFYATKTLDPARVGGDAGRVAEEVISHLAGLVGARVKVTLEIEVEVPTGVPEHVVRVVTENSRSLKFDRQEFESE
jgi:hypothetical protein